MSSPSRARRAFQSVSTKQGVRVRSSKLFIRTGLRFCSLLLFPYSRVLFSSDAVSDLFCSLLCCFLSLSCSFSLSSILTSYVLLISLPTPFRTRRLFLAGEPRGTKCGAHAYVARRFFFERAGQRSRKQDLLAAGGRWCCTPLVAVD